MAVETSPISAFNYAGLNEFRRYLNLFKSGYTGELPDDLLIDEQFSEVVPGDVVVEQQRFELKIDAAQYLLPKLESINYPHKFFSPGLWGWLSAFYFDSVCPPDPMGTRKIGDVARYIADTGRGYHTHLLAFSTRIFRSHGDAARLLLYLPTNELSLIVSQFGSRQDLAMNRGVLDAAAILYWDPKTKSPKSRARSSSKNPGNLRRYVDVIQQLDLTYDLQSMSGEQVIQILPDEFNRWL